MIKQSTLEVKSKKIYYTQSNSNFLKKYQIKITNNVSRCILCVQNQNRNIFARDAFSGVNHQDGNIF